MEDGLEERQDRQGDGADQDHEERDPRPAPALADSHDEEQRQPEEDEGDDLSQPEGSHRGVLDEADDGPHYAEAQGDIEGPHGEGDLLRPSPDVGAFSLDPHHVGLLFHLSL